MITTHEDIILTSLVVQDQLEKPQYKRIRSKGHSNHLLTIDNKLVKHFVKIEELTAQRRRDFKKRWNQNLTGNTPVEEYKFLQTIGIGAFGCVILVKRGEEYYAAKCLDKNVVMKRKQMEYLHQEIRLLDAMRFDFLVHLEDFVRTNCYLILVMPFIMGGEMFDHMRKHGKYDEAEAQFLAAQVVLALEYMHGNGVIYRDLKPENIMIDNTGYIKMTDLGLSKKVGNNRTWSICGTPEYLAPEIILNKGYNRSVDWWAFGVLVFEMTAGYPPFADRDTMMLYHRIVKAEYTLPDHFTQDLQNLVNNLIQVDRSRRYGILKNGVKDIKSHAWFRTVDWDAVLEQTVEPYYKPKVKSPKDISLFRTLPTTVLRESPEDEYPDVFDLLRRKLTPPRKTLLKIKNVTLFEFPEELKP